jgi:hypothetical protein
MGKKLQFLFGDGGWGLGLGEHKATGNIVMNKSSIATHKSEMHARVNGAGIRPLSYAPLLERSLYYRQII